MLTKRTNILFEHELWNKLVKIANAKKVSTSSIVREAVELKFDQDEMLETRRQAIENTRKIRPKPFKGRLDYKELINYGRK